MPSSHLILCRPLLLPPVPPRIRVLSSGSTLCMRWPEYWSFSFSIVPSKEIPGLISFRVDWLDLLAVQGTLRSLLQYYSSKASILRHSAFFMVQLSHPYITIGKTIALTRRTFVIRYTLNLVSLLDHTYGALVYFITYEISKSGLPQWLSGKESACQCRGHRLDPWVRKIPWRRKWELIPVFLPKKSHGQRNLAGYSQSGHKTVGQD